MTAKSYPMPGAVPGMVRVYNPKRVRQLQRQLKLAEVVHALHLGPKIMRLEWRLRITKELLDCCKDSPDWDNYQKDQELKGTW